MARKMAARNKGGVVASVSQPPEQPVIWPGSPYQRQESTVTAVVAPPVRPVSHPKPEATAPSSPSRSPGATDSISGTRRGR